MKGIDTQVTGSSIWVGRTSSTVTTASGFGLTHGTHMAAVEETLAKPVQVCYGDAAQSLELLTAEDGVLTPEDRLSRWSRQAIMCLGYLSQQQLIGTDILGREVMALVGAYTDMTGATELGDETVS